MLHITVHDKLRFYRRQSYNILYMLPNLEKEKRNCILAISGTNLVVFKYTEVFRKYLPRGAEKVKIYDELRPNNSPSMFLEVLSSCLSTPKKVLLERQVDVSEILLETYQNFATDLPTKWRNLLQWTRWYIIIYLIKSSQILPI